ncbi:transcriptional regulator family: Fungal Specific TF [Trichoderma harzianum]|nr:transcriptional regulator family: Fungal Specific TF [Trichoderma harzianum]
MTSKRPQCWECQRRDSPCDGRIPICGNCSDAGMVCPGYNNARPLTWLPTGKVSRLQKQKVKGRSAAPATSRRFKQSPAALTTARASSTPERGASASVASTPPRARRRKGSSSTNSNTIKDGKAKANSSISDTNGPNTSSSGSDRSSDAGTISEASPGDSTSSLVAATKKTTIRSDDGHREDRNEDGLLKEKDSQLQLVASRAQFGSASSSSSRQIHVAHIPPDLRPEQWDFVDAIQYYNNLLLPKMRARQIVQNPAWGGELSGEALQSLTAANRHCILAIAVGYRIMCVSIIHGLDLEPSTSGPASHLWQEFYRHIGKSIRALNDEIQQSYPGNVFNIFSSMAHLMSAEVLVSNSLSWRLHADGYLMLIKHCGGLRKLMDSSTTPLLMQSFVIGITVFNTTSPSHSQMVDACNFDVDDVMALYEIGSTPLFYCPAPLFREIFLINRLRLDAAISDGSSEPSLCDILHRVDMYSVPLMNDSIDETKANALLFIALLFKSSVAIFAALTLPCTSQCSPSRPCAELQKVHRANLFHLLDTTAEFLPLLDHILWPVVVAGTAAATGTVENQMLVEMYLLNGVRDPFTGGCTGAALATMRKFWTSGKTEWDECFDQPHAWMI